MSRDVYKRQMAMNAAFDWITLPSRMLSPIFKSNGLLNTEEKNIGDAAINPLIIVPLENNQSNEDVYKRQYQTLYGKEYT